ncbi:MULTISPECIES: MauE/DoxX family redox-associated membrane protein [Actinomadura]|uniref:MauE/DoxX family redox-associated membrane protein n=1 Tax=Actinomadura yumaensis TaxID=111807 RepID=A0ABW2CS20_9ACTN|nr:MauE/DoxX family redox-associated membrane protein [Actinomadura sp. J1-007]MWK37676.1 hypothetical protein [Actinomadura sp. J1-007]
MSALLAGAGAVAVPVILLGSLFGQLRQPGLLAAALRAQGVLPRSLAAPTAWLAVAAEAVAGTAGALGVLLRHDGTARAGLGAGAVLLAGYAAYAAYVARTRPRGVPCGCAGDAATPMTGWVAARAAALAALAAAGVGWGPPDGVPAAQRAVAAVAGLGLAVILWTLPQAMIEEGAR